MAIISKPTATTKLNAFYTSLAAISIAISLSSTNQTSSPPPFPFADPSRISDLSALVAALRIRSLMESAAVLRSFHGVIQRAHYGCFSENSAMVPINRVSLKTALSSGILLAAQYLKSSPVNRKRSFQPFVKASESSSAVTSASGSVGKTSQGTLENNDNQKSTFPNGVEALILDVCDETNIAELKVKVGDFEMHLKRDIGSQKASASAAPHIVSPTTAPPIPSEPMSESTTVSQPAPPPKPSSVPSSPYAYVSSVKESKLAVLEASGSSGYVLVSSPTVGSYRSGRTVKGKKQPPSCKEGDIIKEGQVIGYLDQFGNDLPIKSDVAGEVLKVLFKDGEAVGYGDPIVAVLPSFRGIK